MIRQPRTLTQRFAIRRLILASLICAAPAAAQVTGSFYLEKTRFSPTEPVFIYFKTTNNTATSIDFTPVMPEQPMCSGISIRLFRGDVNTSPCLDFGENVCILNGQFPDPIRLLPGQSHVDRYLLSYRHDLRLPGDYRVEADRVGFPDNRLRKVSATLRFRVDASSTPISSREIQAWVNQLHSPDVYKRTEAARTLASIAPRSVEQILFGFAGDPELKEYAALALFRLRTPRSMQALADLLQNSPPGSWESTEAAQFLVESGDQKWFPVLLAAARKSPQIGYARYAAELGGKASIPALVGIANSSVNFATYGRSEAIQALGSTHAREAIPVLLGFLKSGDEDTSDRAAQSLRVLTHRMPFADPQARNHNLEVIKWTNWWQREGATARIFRDNECADPIALP